MKGKENWQIFIPTRGRVHDQETWKWIPANMFNRTYALLHKEEEKAWKDRYPDRQYLVHPKSDIGGIRQWLMEQGNTPHLVLDDDLKFYRRKAIGDWHLRYCASSDMRDLFTMLWKQPQALVGVAARQGHNREPENFRLIGRQMQLHGYDPRVWQDLGIKCDRVKLMEDFDIILQLLRAGKQNYIAYEWAIGQRASNMPGGCSLYRTNEAQTAAAQKLAKLHPGFVKVVEKENKNWKGFEKRTDVIVYWKKAYESSL